MVHGLPSSHAVVLIAPGRQAPPPQMSPTVQAFSSVHVAVFAKWTQPVWALQESSVHGSPSLQVPSSVTPSQLSSMPLHTSGTTWPGWQLAVQILPPPLGALAQMPVAQSASTLHGHPRPPPQLVSGDVSAVSAASSVLTSAASGVASSVLASAMSAVSAASTTSVVSAESAPSGNWRSRSIPSCPMSVGSVSPVWISLPIAASSVASADTSPSCST